MALPICHVEHQENKVLCNDLISLTIVQQLDKAADSEVTLFPCDLPAGRVISSPTGPLNDDYADVRSFTDAAKKGIARALKSGVTAPLLVLPSHPAFKQSELVTLLGALEALYVNLQMREDVPEKAQKVKTLGVYSENAEKLPNIIKLASALESGRNIKIGDLSFEEVEKFKYLGATVTNINDTQEEIKRRINMGNACYYSVEKLYHPVCCQKSERIYKTVILLVVLYGCKTWTLTLREEQRLRVFDNKVLRKIFAAKRDEVTGEWRKLHNAELHALYSSPDVIRTIKSRHLRWAGHVAHMGESRNAYRVLVGRPEGKRPLGRLRCSWEDNIKMDLREVGYDGRDWINLAQDRDQWRAYVRAAMNLRVGNTECGILDFPQIGFVRKPSKYARSRSNPFTVLVSGQQYVARDIGGSDPERMCPPKVEAYIRELFKNSNISIEVITDPAVLKREYPLFDAVDRAASHIERHRGRIIYLTYEPSSGPVDKTLFLVGKGVTYDTGGADIKAGGVMAGMSRDKCGAAAVAGFMQILTMLKPRGVKVIGALPIVRNSVGADAYVADEIILSRNKLRVRIGNTDAEGRMIMGDVLCKMRELAEKAVNPHLMTIATLTGHAVLTVGAGYSNYLENRIVKFSVHSSLPWLVLLAHSLKFAVISNQSLLETVHCTRTQVFQLRCFCLDPRTAADTLKSNSGLEAGFTATQD
ncbi:hypothetical protein ANN_02071 [Periplaneta americana]|uniref:Cytosol aminopeptidase domain-containing protein n=1 Tax=Periplaneta americana TaxID=6978 RepID=A0ABQ8TV87_PERAM|nr:hypothetical protein ANN_02071 [Periplaneta americana]